MTSVNSYDKDHMFIIQTQYFNEQYRLQYIAMKMYSMFLRYQQNILVKECFDIKWIQVICMVINIF